MWFTLFIDTIQNTLDVGLRLPFLASCNLQSSQSNGGYRYCHGDNKMDQSSSEPGFRYLERVRNLLNT